MTANLPTVLVVDDEPRSLETLRRTLEEEFAVLTAESAADAEALLESEWVHAILCDQRMPGETGVDFLSRVRDRWPDVGVDGKDTVAIQHIVRSFDPCMVCTVH